MAKFSAAQPMDGLPTLIRLVLSRDMCANITPEDFSFTTLRKAQDMAFYTAYLGFVVARHVDAPEASRVGYLGLSSCFLH
jgi:hypothetical protein